MKSVMDLRPCDNCAGKIFPQFYVIRVSLALIKPQAVNEFFGMHQFFGGRAGAALVVNFAPASKDAVLITGDEEPSLMTELFICHDCYLEKKLDLAVLIERINDRRKRAAEAAEDEHAAKQDQTT